MKIDLFKLNNFNRVELDSFIDFPEEYFGSTEIRAIKDCHVVGELCIDYEDFIMADLKVEGIFILPCAITLEDVPTPFSVKIEEKLGNFEDFYNKSKNSLDILPFLWENIVSEVPIRVVKDGVKSQSLHGDGWELVSSE